MGKGYIGNYMSVHAKEAFDRGEKPWTLWGRKKLVKEIAKKNPEVDRKALESADPDTLKRMYLGYAGSFVPLLYRACSTIISAFLH